MLSPLRVPAVSALTLALVCVCACRQAPTDRRASVVDAAVTPAASGSFIGIDRNDYPGDDRLADLHKHFAFVSYWLTNPPDTTSNSWVGKRALVRTAGFGFLVLANGRYDAQIKKSKLTPDALGKQDAAEAIAAAGREGFPVGTVIFLDQEEGGRLLSEQSAYFFGWTEAIAASIFKPGAYLSGQPSNDGTGPDGKPLFITTVQDVREQVAARHLHPVVFWVMQDACPPAPGCVVDAPAVKASGTLDAEVWQYARTPQRTDLTRSCAKTYAADKSCYAGATNDLFLDLDAATSADPSHGR